MYFADIKYSHDILPSLMYMYRIRAGPRFNYPPFIIKAALLKHYVQKSVNKNYIP